MKKIILRSAGLTAVGLGFAGAFLPVLPTTPFLLLAAWCFAKSSPRLEKWLYENRVFGPYLRNYQAGCGISKRAKAFTILLLWAGIGSTIWFFAESWWLRGVLLAIAVGVTLHIVRMGRSRRKRIVVLIPTAAEAEPLLAGCPPGVEMIVSGVGTTRTLLALDRLPKKPDWVILAGIAGSYPGGDLRPGASVLVAEEREADLGTCSDGEFKAAFGHNYRCPHITADGFGFPVVVSNTVNTAAGPFPGKGGADIENMEGAAFFAASLTRNIPFLELRTVSNRVGEPFEKWSLPLAAERLAEALNKLIDALNA